MIMVIFCLCYGMENTARPTLMSLIPNIFPFSVSYGLLICDSSDCVLHKISFDRDRIITIVGKMVGVTAWWKTPRVPLMSLITNILSCFAKADREPNKLPRANPNTLSTTERR